MYNSSDWSSIVKLDAHTAAVTGLRFGVNSASLVSTSLDKTIKVYSS